MTNAVYNIRSSTINKRKLDDQVPSSSRIRKRKQNPPVQIQFFVRSFPGGKTLVIRADSTDSVKNIHDKIMLITGIPADDQRLIYRGKQLRPEQILADCGIQRDTTMQLVSRMRSIHHPQAPAALVELYMPPDNANKTIANESIRMLVNSFKTMLPASVHNVYCAPIVSEFCKLLRRAAGIDDSLYRFCRRSIGSIVEAIEIARCNATKELSELNDIFLFVREVVVAELSRDLELSMVSTKSMGLSMSIVHDFTEYMCLVRKFLPLKKDGTSEAACDREYIECWHHILSNLHLIVYDLLEKMEFCLRKLEDRFGMQEKGKGKPVVSWWCSRYLVVLKELHSISELLDRSEVFWQKMRQRKVSLCFLIARFARKSDDYQWIIEHKELTNFKVRRHFVMMMLQEVRNRNQQLYEMLIDRSQLLEESFEYIGGADPALLRGDLFMGFKHEEATGPGVLRE